MDVHLPVCTGDQDKGPVLELWRAHSGQVCCTSNEWMGVGLSRDGNPSSDNPKLRDWRVPEARSHGDHVGGRGPRYLTCQIGTCSSGELS